MTEKECTPSLATVDIATIAAVSAIRERYNISYQDIADATKLSQPHIWRILNGKGGVPLSTTIDALRSWLESNRERYPLPEQTT